MNLFTINDQEKHTEILANYFPGGNVFGGKSDKNTNFYKLLFGLSNQYRLLEEKLEITFQEYDIRSTEALLEEWESALGIPDDCFKADGNIEQRRRDINVKFLADSVVTEQDFIDVAALYGVAIVIKNGLEDADVFPLIFPYTFADTKTARFTMIVEFLVSESLRFPYNFPIPFGEDVIEVLKCLFRKLAPANVDIIFRQI